MKYVAPRSSSVGQPNPRVMRELLDFLWKARQELAAKKAAEQTKGSQGAESIVAKAN